MSVQAIYVDKICEAAARINACAEFLDQYKSYASMAVMDAAVLQARKAFEATAYAAIAPNKDAYAKLRAAADKPADFRKDYNARRIFHMLSKLNPNFYPIPLMPARSTGPGSWHFDQKKSGFLTKSRFETLYDRFGKFLHADNPWDDDKGVANLIADLPQAISELRELIVLHKTTVKTPAFFGVWVLEVPLDGSTPKFLIGEANGEFVESPGAA